MIIKESFYGGINVFICENCLKYFINYEGIKSEGFCDFCHIIKSSGLDIRGNVLELKS
jgi:hypothetical protein